MVLFWVLCALLTVGVIVALTRPLVTVHASTDGAHASDLDVYRDQLKEIETDRDRGLIAASEAEAARVEVARRLLTRSAELDLATSPRPRPDQRDGRLFYAVALTVPLLAMLLYVNLGAPALPGRPFAQRQAESQAAGAQTASSDIERMISQVEARLRENPGEGQGWDVVAPIYLRLERFADAAIAFQHAIEILGPTMRRLAGFAEATVLSNNGIVTERARRTYEQMLVMEPGRAEARFGLALAKEQDGDLAAADADYRALLAETPADASWREYILARIDAVAERRGGAGVKPGTLQQPNPDAAAAVAGLPAGDRNAVIMQMVDGLEAKLKANGRDVDGWQRLMRSWSVLGRKERAEAALQDARKALSTDSQALLEINAFAKTLGLGS